MTLYLYKIGSSSLVLTIENVQGYTAERVTALDEAGNAVVYAPLAEDCELSSKADCSETLRADWRAAHPSDKTRVAALEAENKLLKEQVSAQADQAEFYEDCIAEMAAVVYA